MSRTSSSKNNASLSSTQRRACVVMACCVAAIVLSIVLSWVVLPSLLDGSDTEYDPNAYPLDTSLSAILPKADESTDYMSGTVFVGDGYAASLQSLGLITLDQFAGANGLSLTNLPRDACVCFADDPNTYTVPQALAKMKPRRVVLMLGGSDLGNYNSGDAFAGAYRQVIAAIRQAYGYCDIIVAAVAPVRSDTVNSGIAQTTVDAFNQALAVMCQSDGLRFLNTTEILKGAGGFAQDSYFDAAAGTYSDVGGNALLMYFRQHPLIAEDRRPDTNDIPRRAAQPSASGGQDPTPTPTGFAVNYTVEDPARGSLTTTTLEGLAPGAAASGVSRLEYTLPERTPVTVTAEPAAGWVFLRWSDGITTASRTDIVMGEMSVVAVFAQPELKMYWNGSGCDNGQVISGLLNVGDSVQLTARVLVNGVEDASLQSKIEWVVNEQTVAHGGAYTFTPDHADNFDILVGLVLDAATDEAAATSYITVEVPQPPTTIAINEYSANTATSGQAVTLRATVQNGVGMTSWSCDGLSWTAQGDTATFTAPTVAATTQYTVRARNNGAEATFVLTVEPVQAPPTEAPTADPGAQQPAG